MDEYTPEQFEAVAQALGLDPDTTTSIYASPGWIRVEHSDRPASSIPCTPPDESSA